jgi:YegS/Rv2252/BmrU family lipid kinase
MSDLRRHRYNQGIATYRKGYLIYNPYAGRIRRHRHILEESIKLLKTDGHNVKPVSTTGPGSAVAITKCCVDQGADLILVAGGDGTINEVANGMTGSNVPMGILPGGTANVLAMETGVGSRMIEAARNLGSWIPQRVSVGLLNDGLEQPPRYFLAMCGAGLDAHIVYQLSATLKSAFGKLSYWIAGFSQIGRRFPEFDVEVNGQLYRASFALVSRVRNYGGDLNIAPSISLIEDDFEIVLFSGQSSFKYLSYMYGIVRGRVRQTPGITILRSSEVRLFAPEDQRIYSQVDGEYSGHLPVTLQIIPRSLTLLLPKAYCTRPGANASQQEWITSHTR